MSADRIGDFESATMSGMGATLSDLSCENKFLNNKTDGEFSRSGLLDVARNLTANIDRLRAHARLPWQIFNYGRQFQEVFDIASIECERSGYSPGSAEFMAARSIAMRKWILGVDRHDSAIGRITWSHDACGFVAREGDDRESQVEAFCESLIIQGWSLFESLSEELWETAVNVHPKTLSALSGDINKKNSKFSKDLPSPKPDAKLSHNDLRAHGFDLSGKMGEILISKQSVGFTSLNKIRTAFHAAFCDDSKAIDCILDSEMLQFSAAVRNLLVHKRGVVDEEYLKQTALVATAERPPLGEKLPIRGKVCAQIADACVDCAMGLTNAVHAWLVKH